MTKKAEKNKKFIIGLSVIIVAIIIIASAYVAFYSEQPEKKKEPELVKEIDDHISPLVNQGLTFEILRFRHRGLLDEITKFGTSWKNKPKFYFITNIDDLEYISKDVAAAGGAESETLFQDWDTMFQENRVMSDAEEEQETADITLKIMERQKTGLLGRGTQDIEREKIHLVYNYKTGRWTGDDSFKDDDGYGHYVGETFEVWFNIYQFDYDKDGIPYWTEVNVLGTDPMVDDSELDPDNDGVPTSWEWKWGYDPFTWDDHVNLDPDIDGIENIEEYQMSKWLSDPFSQDIYIEADGMERGGLFDPPHVFWDESQQILIEQFCRHGINVYVDNGWPNGPVNGGGEILTHFDTISQESGMTLQFYRNHFPDERKGIFRYLIVCHNAGFCIPSEFNNYDTLTIDSSLYKLILKRFAFTPRTQRIVVAAAAMHELGHSVGIKPWNPEGCDNMTFAGGRQAKQRFLDEWGDYKSVMNYYYMWDKNFVGYSDGSHGSFNDWQHLYLPDFQIESEAIEYPGFEAPGTDEIVNKKPVIKLEGWEYDMNLTQQYAEELTRLTYVESVDCNINVYVKNDSDSQRSPRNIRVYAQPDVSPTLTVWSLVGEGFLDSEDNIHFYSIDNIIDDILSSSD